MQVQFEGDPASALVTFASPMEAEAAFNAPDAVLGNRFIKMFFHHELIFVPCYYCWFHFSWGQVVNYRIDITS